MSTKFKVGDIIFDTTDTSDGHDVMLVMDVKTTSQGTQYYILESSEYNLMHTYRTEFIDQYYSIQPKFKVGDVIFTSNSDFDRIVVGMVTSSEGNKSYLTEFVNCGYEVDAMRTDVADEHYIKARGRNADRATDTRTA